MSSPPRAGRTALSTRFLLYFAIAYAVLIGAMGFLIVRSLENALIEDLTVQLETDAQLAWASFPDDPSQREAWANDVFAVSGLRVTVVDSVGVVLVDSHTDPAVMENHADRPEVIEAMAGEVGVATRTSASTGFEQLYVALPEDDGLVMRVSISERSVAEQVADFRLAVTIVGVTIGLLGIAVVAVLARRLAAPIRGLTEDTRALAAGDTNVVIQRSSTRELDQLGLAISALASDLHARLDESSRSAEMLEVILGALPQGTILVGEDDSITYANSPAYELLGVIPDTLSGLAPHPFQVAVRESRRTRAQQVRQLEAGRPLRRLRGIATPFTEDEQVLLVVIDVTERERANDIRRDFVANASHELKTPVSSIIASAEALQIAVGRGDDSAVSFAQEIERASLQLDRLVGDLLDLSRLERDDPVLAPLRLDLLVREEVERVREKAESRGLNLMCDAEEVDVSGSRRDLAIAVRNLLDNAIRYTSEEGRIDVTVSQSGTDAIVVIRDTGIGIPTRDLDRIFERFYRVDDARSRQTGGTGLGLSIVRHVIESHGGAISVDSELGVGSVFTISLPTLE